MYCKNTNQDIKRNYYYNFRIFSFTDYRKSLLNMYRHIITEKILCYWQSHFSNQQKSYHLDKLLHTNLNSNLACWIQNYCYKRDNYYLTVQSSLNIDHHIFCKSKLICHYNIEMDMGWNIDFSIMHNYLHKISKNRMY